jgi:PAS domain S-box-containing protein
LPREPPAASDDSAVTDFQRSVGISEFLKRFRPPLGCPRDADGLQRVTAAMLAGRCDSPALRANESNEKAQLRLFESIPEAILVHHADGVLFANAACLRMLGAGSYQQIVGRPMLDRIHPRDRRRTEQQLAQVVESGRSSPRFEARLIRFDGSTVDVEASITPIEGRSATELLLVLRDVTERKILEQELRQAQKMEALGQLTGGVAHDFNNLLSVITGNLEIAEEHAAGVPGLGRAVARAMAAAEIGADLTQRLLAFARRRPLQPQLLDLNRLVQDIRDLLRRSLGEDIEIEIVACPDLWPVNADRGQLENSIINMAVNARDAMPDGGKLAIETANIYLDSDYARRNPGVVPGQYVLLEMTDTGMGMSSEVAERAFEPFFTTKEVDRGSGLGLSTIYGFVRQSGGHAKIFSAENHGTSIWLCLPRAEMPEARPAAPVVAEVQWELPRGTETILVVEDNASVREVVVAHLEGLGYRVVAAADGPSALRTLTALDRLDLLFTDLIMPNGMSGRQLADEVIRRRPGTRVLFTSGYAHWSGKRALEFGSDVPMLQKPYKKKKLAETVRQLLNDGEVAEIVPLR